MVSIPRSTVGTGTYPWSEMLVGIVRDAVPRPLRSLDDALEYEVREEKVFRDVGL